MRRHCAAALAVAGARPSMLGVYPSLDGGMYPMPKIASIFRSSLCLAAVLTVALPASQAAALECADKEISARGPTFTPSPETSMEAAKTEWLKKATEIFSDETMAK